MADPVKEGSAEAVGELRRHGDKPGLITGDNEATARAIARQVGVDRVLAEVLPDGKAREIRALAARSKHLGTAAA